MTRMYLATLTMTVVLAWACVRFALRQQLTGIRPPQPIRVPVATQTVRRGSY